MRLISVMILMLGAAAFAAERPNVLLIMVDDMRFDQMTHEGHPYIKTPNLDRLAREGMRFTNAYVTSPLCGPSRVSLFTGRHTSAHGRLNNFIYPQELEPYLPVDFRAAGYRLAMVGKFYEGNDLRDVIRPKAFDRWFQNRGPYWPDYKGDKQDRRARKAFYNARLYYDQLYSIDGVDKQVIGYQTDVLFDESARFAAESGGSPFWISLNPFAPHTPLNPSLKRRDSHKGKGVPPRANQQWDVGPVANPKNRARITEVHERTCEMIEDVDEALGRCLDALSAAGRLDDTIVIFTSDNGSLHGEHGFWWKMNPWQESIRVPLLIRYPPRVQPGTVSGSLVSLADLLVTCAELGRVHLPEDRLRYGRSIVPILKDPKVQVRDRVLIMQYGQDDKQKDRPPEQLLWASLVTADGWKLTRFADAPSQRPDLGKALLFNLNQDPLERKNLAVDPQYADRFARISGMLHEQLRANRAPVKGLDADE